MQVKKTIKTKDKCPSKKPMDFMQEYYKKIVWEHLLYLRGKGISWKQLAYRAFMGESIFGGIPEIRFKSIETPVLSLQHHNGRSRSRVLPQNVHHRRSRIHGKSSKRPASNS